MLEFSKEIARLAESLAAELTSLRRDFHQHPELSHGEERTARVVAAYLQDLGLEVQRGIAGHGVVGTLLGAHPGRVVAFRADMDALPIKETVDVPWRSQVEGIMHACGHDFHLSLGLGAARLLSHNRTIATRSAASAAAAVTLPSLWDAIRFKRGGPAPDRSTPN